jgi:hypothetical protein
MKTFQYGGSFNGHDQPAYTADHVVKCAWGGCPNTVVRGEAFSFILTFATRGADGRLGAFQCPDDRAIFAGNLHAQHFCCSLEHAVLCAHACLDEHIAPLHTAEVAALAEMDKAEADEKAAMEAHRNEQNQGH